MEEQIRGDWELALEGGGKKGLGRKQVNSDLRSFVSVRFFFLVQTPKLTIFVSSPILSQTSSCQTLRLTLLTSFRPTRPLANHRLPLLTVLSLRIFPSVSPYRQTSSLPSSRPTSFPLFLACRRSHRSKTSPLPRLRFDKTRPPTSERRALEPPPPPPRPELTSEVTAFRCRPLLLRKQSTLQEETDTNEPERSQASPPELVEPLEQLPSGPGTRTRRTTKTRKILI